ncbi:MAG: alpha/beta hydrolase [Stappiaceae bacterium]
MNNPATEHGDVSGSFFDGFEEKWIDVPEGEIFCRVAGDGPALLLLHGYPQTSAMWHRVAPHLAENYKVVCPDLRGYGRSHKPATDKLHAPYSKRAMANDLIEVMSALGIERFLIGSHDRGARVAHRMALDHAEKVRALVTLDIAPTREMYREADSAFAQTYWHWYWLTQPAPFPEMLIGGDPDYFLRTKCGAGSAGLKPFSKEALNEYITSFRDPAAIHGACEDYRAAYTIDIRHDDEDEGRKIEQPLLALWGEMGAIEKHFDCIALWRERAEDVRGYSLPGGHYLAEELPEMVTKAFDHFFAAAPE